MRCIIAVSYTHLSILETFSCVIQGIIPYGAQMLIAAKLASLSPLSIIEYWY